MVYNPPPCRLPYNKANSVPTLPTIRPATHEDIPALLTLVNSAYRGESSRAGWTSEADLLDGIRTTRPALEDMLAHPDAVILLYEDGETLAGCVYLEKLGLSMYLGMLSVSPQLQAKGIGKRLLEAAGNRAREQSCTTMEMTVISVRHELIAWYERHGYHQTGEKEPFPTDEEKFGIPRQKLEFVVLKKLL